MANKNTALGAAKVNKKDEFYTQLTDIEQELKHYRKHFKDKVVLCNCDDPFESNFFKYFVLNFNHLGLKKLIATSYATSPIAGTQFSYRVDKNGQMSFTFGGNKDNAPLRKAYKAVVNAVYDKTGNDAVEMLDVAELFKSGENELSELDGNGDFRSEECIGLLKEADIVVTNPPFSLFREYVAQLIEYNKKFVIIGNLNALKYRDLFPLLKENKVWLGASIHSGDRAFYVPEDYPLNATACGIDKNGRRYIRVKGVRWYTNLDIRQRHEKLILVKKYNPQDYLKYDNYGAIDVSKTADIPYDYDGVMGVPITFMDKYNPDQFEIIGRTGNIEWATSDECIFFTPPSEEKQIKYKKQNRTWRVQNGYYVTDDGIAHTVYDRLFIRNKHPERPKGNS